MYNWQVNCWFNTGCP